MATAKERQCSSLRLESVCRLRLKVNQTAFRSQSSGRASRHQTGRVSTPRLCYRPRLTKPRIFMSMSRHCEFKSLRAAIHSCSSANVTRVLYRYTSNRYRRYAPQHARFKTPIVTIFPNVVLLLFELHVPSSPSSSPSLLRPSSFCSTSSPITFKICYVGS